MSLLCLYSSLHRAGEFERRSIFYRQIIWIVISWFFLILFSFINYRLYFDFAFILYGLNLILLILVIFFGKRAMGAQRWLNIWGLTFQPSELSKIILIFILARFFSLSREKNFLRSVFLPFILVIFAAFFIFKQPDLGTASILLFLFFMMGFFSKIKKRYFVFFLIAGLILAPVGYRFLHGYQKRRLIVFLNPNVDPLGAGYTIIQSKIAIGSGKIFGKGFLSGTQNQFNFLPERHTDFIFTVIAEEWGFIGSALLLLIYWFILQKILLVTKELKDSFGQSLAGGISSLFFLHIFINIGMTLGIFPVVGLPLIFLSYGGTNLLVSFILVGIFFNIAHSYND